MAYSIANNHLLRKHFAKIKKIIDIPNLIDIQKNRTNDFCRRSFLLRRGRTSVWKPFSVPFFRSAISAKPAPWSMFPMLWGHPNMM